MNNIKYSVLFFLILFLYAEVDYNSEIQPIFDNNCISCHANGGAYFGGLDLSSYSEVIEGGDSGNTIVPFDFANSLLWQYVNSSYMPPYGSGNSSLTSNQINLIAQWINEGALIESNECNLTTEDILGPYYFEDAPFRSVIAHVDEPGQRLYISGNVKQNDCENSISGSLIEIWQANDEGCYGIVEDCDTGNPENDYFNLRGKFFSDINGDYTFESILPGYYGTRPRHLHIKITTPDDEVLVSQLYFENDPYCENDPWCQDADDRIISLEENEFGLYGDIDLIMNSLEDGIMLGDLNFDSLINILDVVLLVEIVIDEFPLNDFQVYSGDLNNDNIFNVLDIVQLVNIILNPSNQLSDECYIIPEVGPCFGICPTYYYNQSSNQCEEFITGCCGIDAFNTLQECQNTCE
jgi:protocatechuate 3,4-dioxygenase beta subunit